MSNDIAGHGSMLSAVVPSFALVPAQAAPPAEELLSRLCPRGRDRAQRLHGRSPIKVCIDVGDTKQRAWITQSGPRNYRSFQRSLVKRKDRGALSAVHLLDLCQGNLLSWNLRPRSDPRYHLAQLPRGR